MNRLRESSPQRKRQKVSPSLTNEESILYNLIYSKKDIGIWTGDMKRETNLPVTVFNKTLKELMSKSMIKEVTTIQNKGRKHYMAIEFEPSKEITGGNWYTDGKLDTDFIAALKDVCFKYISKQKVSTLDGFLEWSKKNGIFNSEVTPTQVEDIMKTLVLDDAIVEVTSNGYGDFASIPVGRVCYKCKSNVKVKGELKYGLVPYIPCFACPRISFCSPDGVVSPRTCVYYDKWHVLEVIHI
ncbi:uncharacterized protein [Cicer arietinum]|uniref:uncharacterized protein isoform X1 n=1 Tax=Cicer arietinum TaxID=3827 RepID=UPI003CC5C58A